MSSSRDNHTPIIHPIPVQPGLAGIAESHENHILISRPTSFSDYTSGTSSNHHIAIASSQPIQSFRYDEASGSLTVQFSPPQSPRASKSTIFPLDDTGTAASPGITSLDDTTKASQSRKGTTTSYRPDHVAIDIPETPSDKRSASRLVSEDGSSEVIFADLFTQSHGSNAGSASDDGEDSSLEDHNETDALLGDNAPQDRRSLIELPRAAKRRAKKAASGIWYIITHPVTSTTAFITALPTAIYGLTQPSGKEPKDIGSDWWNNMSPEQKTLSVFMFGFAQLVNTIMNALFIPVALKKFKESISHTFDNVGSFVDNTASIILAIGGAIAAAAIAYSAFSWLPYGQLTAIIPLAFSAVITLASRFIGVKSIFHRIHRHFSDDIKTQHKLADQLKHLNPRYKNEMIARYQEELIRGLQVKTDRNEDAHIDDPIIIEEFNQITQQLAIELDRLASAHPDALGEPSTKEYAAKYSALLFDVTMTLFFITPASFLTYMQKGYEGVKLMQGTTTAVSDLNIWAKRGIGALPGLASALMYASNSMEIRQTVIDLTKQLYNNPKQIPGALTLLVANGFASIGMMNLATTIINGKDNITGIPTKVPYAGSTFEVLNAVGAFSVNFNSSVKKAYFSSAPTHETTYDDFVNILSRSEDYPVSHETAQTVKRLSFFQAKDGEQDLESGQLRSERNLIVTV